MKESASVFSEKSEESMSSARACFEGEYYNSCVNRAYYAMFQIAVAALFRSGHKPRSEKIGHDWVQAEFTRVFVRRKKRFPRLKGFLNLVQEARDIADYSTERISKKRAGRILNKAEMFIKQVVREETDDDT